MISEYSITNELRFKIIVTMMLELRRMDLTVNLVQCDCVF